MATQFEVYKCALCGNVIEILHAGDGELSCCGQPMKHMVASSVDAAREKHVPVLEAGLNGGCKVKVGAAPHVMEEKHWIEWIEISTADGKRYKKILNPGDAPEAEFCCISPDQVVSVREYCNLHGLWKA